MNKILALILLLAASVAPLTAMAFPSGPQSEGIESVAENEATLSSQNSELIISNSSEASMKFYVFSITGQMVKSVEVGGGDSVTVELPAGWYIVKCSLWSKKIVVK